MTLNPRSRALLALALCGALGLGACAAPQHGAVGGEVEGADAGAQAACKCQAGWSQAPPPAGELTEAAIKESQDKAGRP